MGQTNSHPPKTGKKTLAVPKPENVQQNSNPPSAPKSFESFVSVSWEPLHKELYESIFNIILQNGLFFNSDEERKKSPFRFKSPEELQVLFDFKLGMNGVDHDALKDIVAKVIRYSPHHSHPLYLDKFSAGLDPYAIAGDILATALSSPVITYFAGPVFTLMEEEVKKRIRELIGYAESKGDGIICPGAGFASVMALRLALHKGYPELKRKGYFGIGCPKICFFISEHSTKAFQKAAFIDGIGEAACISIKTDTNGRMSLESLMTEFENSKANGFSPLMVVATAGTASLGAIDPIEEIATFCEKHNIWLHVDADYAGTYFMSDKHKDRLKGIERSDSVNSSPTGMLGASYCNNFVVTRHEKLFLETFGAGAQYVFAKTTLYDPVWDNGDRTLQTTRRADILRLWIMWKAKGRTGLAQHVEYIHDLSKYFVQEVRNRGRAFHLILEDYDSTKVSFYYVPRSLRDMDRGRDSTNPTMKTFSKKLKAQLLLNGTLQIGVSSLPNHPDFFTVSVTNSSLTQLDISYILDRIELTGEELLNSKLSTNGNQDISTALPKIQPPRASSAFPSFVSAPIKDFHKSFFEKVFKLISDKALYFQDKRRMPAYKFLHPEALLKAFDFDLGSDDKTEDEVIQIMSKIIDYSTLQAHPYFVWQLLSAGMDPYSIMAEFVLATQPSSMLTYEQAPIYSLMEKEVCKMVRERIGFPAEGDGTLCPGGSIAVVTSIYTAIASKFPGSRENGMAAAVGKKLVIYLSEKGHICFQKGSLLQGIGIDNCVFIPADDNGKMLVSELKMAIKKTLSDDGIPFLVGATSGTTVIGAFDPLNEIADVCEEYNLWLHSDASLGGSVMMSDSKKQSYLRGIERVDSVNFNTHKLFGVPLEGSILVFKEQGILRKTFGTEDPINFPSTLLYCPKKYDMTGSGGIQTDRRGNIFKFWFLWKAKGIVGMGKHVDYAYTIKDYAVGELKKRSDAFQIWKTDFEFPAVCFYYIPKKLRGLDRNSKEFKSRINETANLLRNELLFKTSIVVGTLSDGDSPLLLKLVLMSSGLIREDIDYMLDQIDLYGKDLDV